MSKKYNKDYFKQLRAKSSMMYDSISALNWGEMVEDKYIISDRYHLTWKVETGPEKHLKPIVGSVEDYILNFRKKTEELFKKEKQEHREVTVYIGTDSQNYLAYTRFVSVIVLYVERNGAHVLVAKNDMPKIYDYRYRLLKEVDITGEIARSMKPFLKENGFKFELHSDFNSSTNHKSNGVVTEASNYLKHLGFSNHKIKDQSWAASYAADHFCK